MELSPRKKAILSAVIKEYISSGEPVGSKALLSSLENSPSSATIRNEMNDLCSLGLLFQPHISAGRIPTDLGFKLYVSSLLKPTDLSPVSKEFIDKKLNSSLFDSASAFKAASDSLNSLYGLPAVYTFVSDDSACLKAAKLYKLTDKSAALMVFSSDGRFQSRIIRVPGVISGNFEMNFRMISESRLKNKRLIEFSRAHLQSLVANISADSCELMPVFSELYDMISSDLSGDTQICGLKNLYKVFGENQASAVAELFEKSDLFSLIGESSDDKSVFFGSDTPFRCLSDKVIVWSDCFSGASRCGRIGVIGPDRISYDQIVPAVKYAASVLSDRLTEAAKDMEE